MVKTPDHILNLLRSDTVFLEYYTPVSIESGDTYLSAVVSDNEGGFYSIKIQKLTPGGGSTLHLPSKL